MKFLAFNQTKLGGSLSLPAHGRAGTRATPFLAALFVKQKTKLAGEPGFEPGLTAPKAAVLPLHNSPMLLWPANRSFSEGWSG